MIGFEEFGVPLDDFVPYDESVDNIRRVMTGKPFTSFAPVPVGRVCLEGLDFDELCSGAYTTSIVGDYPMQDFSNIPKLGGITTDYIPDQFKHIVDYVTEVEMGLRARAGNDDVLYPLWVVSSGYAPKSNRGTDDVPHFDYTANNLEGAERTQIPRVATWIVSDIRPTVCFSQEYPGIDWAGRGNRMRKRLGLDSTIRGGNKILQKHTQKHTKWPGAINQEHTLYRVQGVHARQVATENVYRNLLAVFMTRN